MDAERKEVMDWINKNVKGYVEVEWEDNRAVLIDGAKVTMVWKQKNAILGLTVLELLES